MDYTFYYIHILYYIQSQLINFFLVLVKQYEIQWSFRVCVQKVLWN